MPEPAQFQSGGVQLSQGNPMVAGEVPGPVPDVMEDASNSIVESLEHMQKVLHGEVERRTRAEADGQRLQVIIEELRQRVDSYAKAHSEISNQ